MQSTLIIWDKVESIERLYNGDHDLIPGAPVVTWTDNQLACAITRMLTVIESLNDRIAVLENERRERETVTV